MDAGLEDQTVLLSNLAFKIAFYRILPNMSLNKLKSTLLTVRVYSAACFPRFPKDLGSYSLGITAVKNCTDQFSCIGE